MLFSDTLYVGGGGSPVTPADPHPVGAVGGQLDAVHPGGRVRVGVARAGDLVEQLRGDGVDADQPAGAGVLGDHRRSVGVDFGQREAGVRSDRGISVKNEKLPPVAWMPHSMTCPATTAPASRS